MTGDPGPQIGADRVHAVISDTHGGHTVGLLRPGVSLPVDVPIELGPKSWQPALNPLQELLWKSYTEDIAWLRDLAGDRPITMHHNGDPTQGTRFARELVSTREADQFLIAAANLGYPIEELPTLKAFYLTMGTGVHEFGEGTSTIVVRELLKAKYPEMPIELANHWLAEISGIKFDLAHHGPKPGKRKWLESNNLRWYLQDTMERDLDNGNIPADVYVRSHYHTMAKATHYERRGTRYYTSHIVVTPGYTGIDMYAKQGEQSKWEVTVGLVAFEISRTGAVAIREHFRILDFRKREIVQ